MNLTEKWKKGELPSGWYYVRLIRGEYRIDLYINGKNEWIDCPDDIIDTVVCEVPSYDEYQQLLSDQLAKNEGAEINAELEAENEKLKELLKECYLINEMVIHTFNWLETIVTPSQKHICPKVVGGINKTQQRINQVLGEE